MELSDCLWRRRLVVSTILFLPCMVSAAGFEISSARHEHMLSTSVALSSVLYREDPEDPARIEQDTDSTSSRVRDVQHNHADGFEPVANWSHTISLSNAVALSEGTVSATGTSRVDTKLMPDLIQHRAELVHTWQKNSQWEATRAGSSRSDTMVFFSIAEPQLVLVDAFVRSDNLFPGVEVNIHNMMGGPSILDFNWPMVDYDTGHAPPGAFISYEGRTKTIRLKKLVSLEPGDYFFQSFISGAYRVGGRAFLEYDADNSGIGSVSMTVVPEPGSVAMAVFGGMMLVTILRRRLSEDARPRRGDTGQSPADILVRS